MNNLRTGVVISSEFSGGAEQYLVRLYSGLRGRGVEGCLLGTLREWESTGLPSQDIGFGAKWSRHSIPSNLIEISKGRNRAIRLCRTAHSNNPFAMFHAQFKREQILLTRELAGLAPVIWTEHGRFYHKAGATLLRNLYRRASEAVGCIICVSDQVADDVSQICGKSVRIETLPNSVDTHRFAPSTEGARRRGKALFNLDPDRPVIVAHVRLVRDKNVGRAIKALHGSPAQLLIVGDGPERDQLEAMVNANKADVRFIGHVEEPAHLLQIAEASIICASPWEGHNLASLEAAASGCFLFGFVGDPTEDFITRCGGVLLEEGESLCQYLDESELGLGGKIACEFAKNFDLDLWLSRHEEIFRGLC